MEYEYDHDLYTRQEDLDVKGGGSVRCAVVGCGGVGFWVGLFTALGGARHIELFDGDTLEKSNLNRMAYPFDVVGKSKSEALEELIHSLRPATSVTARPHFNALLHEKILSEMSHVIVSTDNLKSRMEIHALSTKHGVRYIECGAEGLQASATSDPPEWSTKKEETPGYEVIPSFVGPCVIAAALSVTQAYCESFSTPSFTYQASWNHEKDMVKLFGRKEQ